MRHSLPVTALLSLSLAAGCDLFIDEDDDTCLAASALEAAVGTRNPSTGQCEYSVGNRRGCGPQPLSVPQQIWPLCESQCTALGEALCQDASGCQATYLSAPPDGDSFYGCWATLPDQAGAECESLSDWECSTRDDCNRFHAADDAIESGESDPLVGSFLACSSEVPLGCYSDQECAPGYECTADTECLSPPGCDEGHGRALSDLIQTNWIRALYLIQQTDIAWHGL